MSYSVVNVTGTETGYSIIGKSTSDKYIRVDTDQDLVVKSVWSVNAITDSVINSMYSINHVYVVIPQYARVLAKKVKENNEILNAVLTDGVYTASK